MPTPSRWSMSPRQSIERECALRGRDSVIAGCRALLRGERVDAELLFALGGPASARFDEPRDDDYWLRVWGARGLLWAWDDTARSEIGSALGDPSWRVREMALKVVARNSVVALIDDVEALRADEVARVRREAERAAMILIAEGA